MSLLFAVIGWCLRLFTLYYLVIACFALKKRKTVPYAPPKTRFAVLLAARNEEAVIEATVASLLAQRYPRELFDVFVIPNNCTDRTEEKAKSAGAGILHCFRKVRNKGDALHQGFQQLMNAPYDAFCVFDADNLVDPDFLIYMNNAFCAGARAAKGRQRAMNPYDSWVSGCYDIYFELFNVFFNRPRGNIGLSAKLVGTGFAVRRDLLQQMGGWNTKTMAEDAEFASQCAMEGEKVWWVPEALTYDEEPVSFRQSLVQRRRWSSGVMETARVQYPRMAEKICRENAKLVLDMAAFLAGPFVQLASFLFTGIAMLSCAEAGNWQTFLYGALISFIGSVAAAGFAAFAIGKRERRIWKSVLLFPVFMASWLPLQWAAFFRKTHIWSPIAHNCRRGKELMKIN